MAESGGGNSGGAMSSGGGYMAIAGSLVSAIGAYYEARNKKFMARSQAMTMEYEGSIADLNARQAARDAETIFADSRYERMRVGMQSAQDRAAMEVMAAAGGVQAGVGSAAEALASRRLVQQLDEKTIAMNRSRDISRARTQEVSLRNAGNLSRMSAANIRRMGGAISPGAAFHLGLLGSSGPAFSSFGGYSNSNSNTTTTTTRGN